MRHLFIINPVAGGSNQSGTVTAQIIREMSGRETDFQVYVTRGPMDAAEKIRREADTGEELRVYACGGDGTLNECVCGAAERPNVAVTHFPWGTGNDFIKTFGEDRHRFQNLAELLDGEIRPVDVILCNDRYAVNICSVGIDARIGTQVHRYSGLPVLGGAGGYILSTAAEVIKGVSQPIRVTVGSRVMEGDKTLVCICNGSWYGGFFNPVPEARIDDGLLDTLVVRGVSRLTFARLVGDYARGRSAKYPKYIERVRSQSVVIDSPGELVVNLDGEAMRASHVEMCVIPGGVNFIFPRNLAYFKIASAFTDISGRKRELSTAKAAINCGKSIF